MVLTASRLDLAQDFRAPDFNLLGTDNKYYTLQSFPKKILVLIFMCNHCPYVQAVLPRLNNLAAEFQPKGVQFIGINVNDATDYPEDSFAKMQAATTGGPQAKVRFLYLRDESQQVAESYRAVCTPDIFVFDQEHRLQYHGRVDDNWQNPGAVQQEDLREALVKILQGEKVAASSWQPSLGCSIKWKK